MRLRKWICLLFLVLICIEVLSAYAYAQETNRTSKVAGGNDSTKSSLDPAIIAISGVIIGGLFGLFTPLISNLILAGEEKKKWTREQEAERDKWFRERLQEIYGNCLEGLSSQPFDHGKTSKWLELLLVYYPDKNSQDYYHFLNLVAAVVRGNESDLITLHRFVVEIASIDPRLQGSGKPAEPSAIYWGTKGNILMDYGNYAEAIAAYDKAISLFPDYPVAHYNKGYTLSEIGKQEEAIKSYENAIKLSPYFKEAWLGKGDALKELGRENEAQEAYSEAKKLEDYK